MTTKSLLQVLDIETCYGDAQALFGVTLAVAEGEFVTLLGRNGMGKTTTVRSIMGIMTPRQGRLVFAGQDITHLITSNRSFGHWLGARAASSVCQSHRS